MWPTWCHPLGLKLYFYIVSLESNVPQTQCRHQSRYKVVFSKTSMGTEVFLWPLLSPPGGRNAQKMQSQRLLACMFLFCWTLIWTKTLFKSDCAFVFSEAWNNRIHKIIYWDHAAKLFLFLFCNHRITFMFFCTAPGGHEKDCKLKTLLFQKFSEHQIFSGLGVWLVHLQIVIIAVWLLSEFLMEKICYYTFAIYFNIYIHCLILMILIILFVFFNRNRSNFISFCGSSSPLLMDLNWVTL